MAISGDLRQYDSQDYNEWVAAHDTLQEGDRQAIRDSIRRLPQLPMFSFILLPAVGEEASASPITIASVCRQLYPHWELWLPAHVSPDIGEARLRVIPSEDKSSTNPASLLGAGVAAAEGEFVLPLPSHVTVCESALYELAVAIGHNPAVDLLYTDEDCMDAVGKRYAPYFKTAWDPDLILGRDSVGLLAAYRRALLVRLTSALLNSPTVALTLYDVNLRVGFSTSAGRIEHIPAVLCHRLGGAEAPLDRNTEGGRRIVRQHLAERGIVARVVPTPLAPAWNRIIREVPDPAPLVSVIVPTRDRADLLERCADALLNRTAYPAIELFVVDNDSCERETAELLRRLSGHSNVQILSYDGPFNYSAMNNLAARQAHGEILLLLNNDIDAIEADWLQEMVSHALQPDVGAVGAKLLYENEQVQHAGIVLGPGLALSHQFRFADRLDTGPCGELALARTVMAVTGACLALRRNVFFEVGGLDENLGVAFNDVDLCMRIGDHGYRIVWTPFAELFHLEGASRGYDTTPDKQLLAAKEFQYFCRSWGSLLEADPYQNPNIACGWDTRMLAAPSKRRRPWLTEHVSG